MSNAFIDRLNTDLTESQINWKVALAFIPIAFFTYVFHESGHWLFGELTGNTMTLSLNNSAPKSGHFANNSEALWSAIGGPAFTILQALIASFFVIKKKSIYAYSFVFFAAYSRFFSIVFGGLSLQDEARIASLLNISEYLVAAIVLAILFAISWRCSSIMKFNMKAIGYQFTLSTMAILLVIGYNNLIN